MDIIEAKGVRLMFDPQGGVISEVVFVDAAGGELRPLHKAPWVRNNEILPSSVPLIEQKLAGDFFCAPFASSGPDVPLHGWTANGDWEQTETPAVQPDFRHYRLRQDVEGARVTKEIRLRDGHPVVYLTHEFIGGTGNIPIAHHAMLHAPGGVRLSFSKKIYGDTWSTAPETDSIRGRSLLEYPQRFDHLDAVRCADGSVVNATFYPFDTGHEDVMVLTEQSGKSIGWSAAVGAKDGFVFFGIKDSRVLPNTVLWMSNGGRFYSPWNGRHTAVIGIEEAAVSFDKDDDLNRYDATTGLALAPSRSTKIRYAFGAIAVPEGWTRVTDIAITPDQLTITDVNGDSKDLLFNGRFFDD